MSPAERRQRAAFALAALASRNRLEAMAGLPLARPRQVRVVRRPR